MGKEEIVHYEQFLLCTRCFQKTCTADIKKPGLVWELVKKNEYQSVQFGNVLWLHIAIHFLPNEHNVD